jgi:hypothetical protein
MLQGTAAKEHCTFDLFLIVKSLPPHSLLNRIIERVFYFSDIFNCPKNISICNIFCVTCILIYSLISDK